VLEAARRQVREQHPPRDGLTRGIGYPGALSMASRQEEKEQRRLEREQVEAACAARSARMRAVLFGLIAVLVIAAGGYGIYTALSGKDSKSAGKTPTANGVKLPEPVLTDLAGAAKAAGCTVTNPKYEGNGHITKKFAASDYKTNPPTSGAHYPEWYDDGIYAPGSTPELGKLVHTLEHGRIDVQYKKGTPAATVKQLEAFLAEKTGYHLLLFENTTDMPYAVAATAWTHALTCETMNPKVFDALRTFYQQYVDKGPEQVP
jgi:hypothetical protein